MNFKQEIDELKYAVAELQERLRIHIRYDIKPTYPIKAPPEDVAIGYPFATSDGVTGLQSVVFKPAEKKLKSLKEHNEDVLNKFIYPTKKITGIGCPKCGKELRNSGYPVFVECLLRIQFPVHCPECGWTGLRY